MKINFSIDTTPEEMRRFFGLPDVSSLQEEMLNQVRENMKSGMEGFDAMSLMKPWLPPHLQQMETMQKAFWDVMMQQNGEKKDEG
jgi:hypothetical protein